LGLFNLPLSDVEIELDGYDRAEAARFMERFHLVFRKGRRIAARRPEDSAPTGRVGCYSSNLCRAKLPIARIASWLKTPSNFGMYTDPLLVDDGLPWWPSKRMDPLLYAK
jgi:hypothetical protein